MPRPTRLVVLRAVDETADSLWPLQPTTRTRPGELNCPVFSRQPRSNRWP